MRLAAALAVIAVAWAAALYLHQRRVVRSSPLEFITTATAATGLPSLTGGGGAVTVNRYVHPTWEDPVALGIAIGSLAAAAGIVGYRRTE